MERLSCSRSCRNVTLALIFHLLSPCGCFSNVHSPNPSRLIEAFAFLCVSLDETPSSREAHADVLREPCSLEMVFRLISYPFIMLQQKILFVNSLTSLFRFSLKFLAYTPLSYFFFPRQRLDKAQKFYLESIHLDDKCSFMV